MKKIGLTLIGILLILVTIQMLLDAQGGVRGMWHEIQYGWYNKQAVGQHDPGQCAFIGDYMGEWDREYLRDKCLAHYMLHINTKSDCGTFSFINSGNEITAVTMAQYYRQDCLIDHYKHMLGNNLTMQWLPNSCTEIADKLIVLSYYFKQIQSFVNRKEMTDFIFYPMGPTDIAEMERCEWTLDTAEVYSYLRWEWGSEKEARYVELQKEKLKTPWVPQKVIFKAYKSWPQPKK